MSDADWLPTVGTECEVNYCGSWYRTTIVGMDGGLPVFKTEWVAAYRNYACGSDFKFRPMRSEEDLAIGEMLDLDEYDPDSKMGMMSREDFCRSLYRAGYRKQKDTDE